MGIFEIFLIGVGLSMDAFAVSVCKGLSMSKVNKKQALTLGLFFGGFQAFMPLLGYFLGDFFYAYIYKFGPWISCGLLCYIGGKMAYEGYKDDCAETGTCQLDPPLDIKEVFMLAVATSIDAFAVGVTFSLLSVNIFLSIIIIGFTTFVLSIIAVYIGHIAGQKYSRAAQITGGVVLIIIGLRILISSLMG